MKSLNQLKLILFIILSTIFLQTCSTASYMKYRIAPDYPKIKSSDISLPGLIASVKIYYDPAGIPHIVAQNEEDLFRAVGFVQGRDRFFEMDALRRVAQGRLSELVGDQVMLGSSTVDYDLSMRGWGMGKAAVKDAANMDPSQRKLMTAYTEGVNHALSLNEPLEYRLLRVKPEPWTIEDSFALGRINAWGITNNWHQETSRLLLALHVGIDRAEKIYGNDWWHGGFSIDLSNKPHPLPPAIADVLRPIFPPHDTCNKPDPVHAENESTVTRSAAADQAAFLASASNSWVLGGDLTASGKPLIANDPHLSHFLPSLVYQMHLKTPDMDVIGGTMPGIPYILMGHNKDAAWAMTSTVGDNVDLFIESLNPEKTIEYKTPSGWRKFENTTEIIKVKTNKGIVERRFVIRNTIHGPVMNDVYPGLLPKWAPVVSIRWIPAESTNSITSIGQANRAKNVRDVRLALSKMSSPISTWTAADKSGSIAIFATGTLPVRKGFLGTFPVPGWLDGFEWTGKTGPLDLPSAEAKIGFFAHANNLMVDPSKSDVLVNIDSAPSYRFDRISQLIKAGKKHDMESMAEMQRDVELKRAERLAPIMISDLEKSGDLTPDEKKALQILKNWDYFAKAESPGPLVFFATYREAIIEALKDELDEKGLEFLLSQRYSTNVADLWFMDENHVVWDNRCSAETERRPQAVKTAFSRAVKYIIKELGPDTTAWRWGALHDQQPKHFFGSKKSISSVVNLPRSEAGGALDSIWKAHFDMGNPKTPFRATAGPVYRMIVDMSDLDHGKWIIDTGASGWPGSPHYGDQYELWRKGETLPMTYNWDEVASSATAVVTLK